MISPNTKPGTFVACIDPTPTYESAKPHVRPEFWGLLRQYFREGVPAPLADPSRIFTVLRIVPHRMAATGFAVELEEVPGRPGPLGCFRVVELPSCLTSLLTEVPTLENA